MKFAYLVMGPAGTGKSTFCHTLQDHALTSGRAIRVVNLDPAAEAFKYSVTSDIRTLVSVDDVTEALGLGPNGGLLYCMQYLADNLDWLEGELEAFAEDDFVLFDCPGQIELYSHDAAPMRRTVETLVSAGFRVGGTYLIDAFTVTDAAKLLSACLASLSAMMALELPHINVLTKCDLVEGKALEKFLEPDADAVIDSLHSATGPRFKALNRAFGEVLRDYSMVSFVPLNIRDEDSVGLVLAHLDNAVQYGEDMEPKEIADYEDNDDGQLARGVAPAEFFNHAAGAGGER